MNTTITTPKVFQAIAVIILFALSLVPTVTQANEEPACPWDTSQDNVYTFSNNRLVGESHQDANKETDPASVSNFSAGTYDIKIFTSDSYDNRASASQPRERSYLSFRDSGGQEIAKTGNTNELADGQTTATITSTFNNVEVGGGVSELVGVHAYYDEGSVNSHDFTCAKLDKQDEELDISIIDQRCVNNDGVVEIDTPNGLDSYKLVNTTTGNTVVNDTDGASEGSITISDLSDGDYRFEATIDGNTETLNFTVDCDEDEEDDLTGSCSVSADEVEPGEDVTFSSNASGGDSPYSFSWELEGSNDDDDTRNVTTSYDDEGTYDGTVTITDDSGDQITRTCSVRVEEDDDDNGGGGGGGDRLDPRDDDDGDVRGDRDEDFSVQCLPESSIYRIGEEVLFEATIDGDIDEDDVEFDWSGDGSLDEADEKATVQYTTSGVKTVKVEAEYDGDTESDTCYVQIGRGEGVSLDQVPYTGPGDTAKTLGFIATIILLAMAGGYALIKKRADDGIPVGIPTNRS